MKALANFGTGVASIGAYQMLFEGKLLAGFIGVAIGVVIHFTLAWKGQL